MFSFSCLVLFAAVIIGAVSLPTNATEGEGFGPLSRSGTPNTTGTSDGYYYYWWTDGAANATYTNGPGGQYTLTWSGDNGHLVGGKGWNPGTNDGVIKYTGTYQPDGDSYLLVHGWTRNPLVEYYIVESYGSYNPASAATSKGSVTCDGANYIILTTTRINQPSIDGTQTFPQHWSVRNPKKSPGGSINGSVSTGCHFTAWKNLGLSLGTEFDHQIVATEAYQSSGFAAITVS